MEARQPFYLRPRPAVLPWLARFALAARHWEDGARAIRELSVAEPRAARAARRGARARASSGPGRSTSTRPRRASRPEADAADGAGLRYEVLDAEQTRALEPALIGPGRRGRSATRTRAASTRSAFVEAVGRAAVEAGVEIRTGVEVRSLDELQAETVVVAAGAWSRELVDLPLEGGKGYHVDFALDDGDPRIPAWVQETWTIATPLPDRLRLSGTLELAGLDLSISQSRVDTIRRGGDRWFRGLAGRPVLETWAGLRPVPAGRPAGDRPAGPGRGRNRSRDEGRLALAGHRAARRAARRRRGAGPRPRAVRPGAVLGRLGRRELVLAAEAALELAAAGLERCRPCGRSARCRRPAG